MRWSRLGPLLACVLVVCARSSSPASPATVAADEKILRAARVGTGGAALVEYFRNRTLTPGGRAAVAALVRQLGDLSYRVRQKASVRLVAKGNAAVPALEAAVNSLDAEVARRAREALRRIRDHDLGPAVTAAAARLLVLRKPTRAVETLLDFLPFAENDSAVGEVLATLTTLTVSAGKSHPALVAALGDREAARRAGAAEVLCRAGVKVQRPAVRKLLRDPEPNVRLRAGIALVSAGEKETVPVLIDLLPDLPPAQAYLAQDFLYRLGEGNWPSVPLDKDGPPRRKWREAWVRWWRKYGPKVDLARLKAKPRLLGYTMLVLLDEGKVLERDADGKERWQIGELSLPLDVQMLSGERLLIAEHGAGRVTERNTRGEILWQKKISEPVMAQRLPGGHTLITTRNRMVQVDRAGKEVIAFSPPGNELFARANRLPSGNIACVTMDSMGESKFVLLNPSGKPLRSFRVNVSTFGGRIEVLPDGHVLVPEMSYRRVVEYDAEGKGVREVRVDRPVAAVRLANGNILVTTYSQKRAIEFDRKGDEVAEFRAETRVTRAWRR